MWAMIPILRVLSSAYCRSTSALCFPDFVTCEEGGQPAPPSLHLGLQLPAIMRERLVGLRHLVRVFSLLHGCAAIARRVEQLGGQLVRHAALGAPAGGADDPPHGERRAPIGTHPDRHPGRPAA